LICANGKIGCSVCQEIGNIYNFKNTFVEISPEWAQCSVSGGTSCNKKQGLLFFAIK